MTITCFKSCFTSSKRVWKEIEDLAERLSEFEQKIEKIAKDIGSVFDATDGKTTLNDLGEKIEKIEKDFCDLGSASPKKKV